MVSYKKIMVWQLKHSLQMYKCMLTDASLKVEIVKNNKKSMKIFFRNILNPLMAENPKRSDTL